MKLPLEPPPFEELFAEVIQSGEYMELSERFYGNVPKKYLRWDQLRHRQIPDGLTLRQWWHFIKIQRVAASKKVTLPDKQGNLFSYNTTESISQVLHGIDMESGGSIQIEDKSIGPHTRDRHLVRSLIEEAITSSQIEGASTTRLVAKNLIQTGRKPSPHFSPHRDMEGFLGSAAMVFPELTGGSAGFHSTTGNLDDFPDISRSQYSSGHCEDADVPCLSPDDAPQAVFQQLSGIACSFLSACLNKSP